MTEKQKKEIIRLRMAGCGYKRIAALLNISRDRVKYFCKNNGLSGFGKNIREKDLPKPEETNGVCKCCGLPIEQPKKGRTRKYCSMECKKLWEKTHYKLHEHKCFYCGKVFESKSKAQKFCSKDCYYKYRFYREEDVNMIAEYLKKGRKPEYVPNWIKEMLCNEEGKMK